MDLSRTGALLDDEIAAEEIIREMRREFSPALFGSVVVKSRDLALERGIYVVKAILWALADAGLDLRQIEPGHGIGHIVRDYANGLVMLKDLAADPRDIFIGFIAGVLHDAGCAVVPRYSESKRVIRHAEAIAILLHEVFADNRVDLNDAEQILVQYAVAAHTHYLKPFEVKGQDGRPRVLEPYVDLYENGKPILAVWIPIWIDRLDCSGPCFPARHFLTLSHDHEDFDGKSFYGVNFADHMRPIIRTAEEIKAAGGARTMLEHLKMFADLQTNLAMVSRRDAMARDLNDIIESTFTRTAVRADDCMDEMAYGRFADFLGHNIEPTELGRQAAALLGKRFMELDSQTRGKWLNAFWCMEQRYLIWSEMTLGALDMHFPDYLELPGIGNIDDILSPHESWTAPDDGTDGDDEIVSYSHIP
ncbi:MAG: hypothetical protein PHW53_04335 [Patescibacteria group bacterium]|nr:hypothetical protein [Patescibacteria group bacterium]